MFLGVWINPFFIIHSSIVTLPGIGATPTSRCERLVKEALGTKGLILIPFGFPTQIEKEAGVVFPVRISDYFVPHFPGLHFLTTWNLLPFFPLYCFKMKLNIKP